MTSSDRNKTVLVTGGSGFLALHAIQQLLNKGYLVRATLRSLQKKADVIEALKNGGIVAFDKLRKDIFGK